MSNYRDDNTDTAIASDSVHVGLKTVFEDIARLSDAIFFSIAIICSSTAIASDEVFDTTIYGLSDTAIVSDSVFHQAHASQQLSDKARVSDSVSFGLQINQYDSATLADTVMIGNIGSVSIDAATVLDSVTSQRVAHVLASDSAKISDTFSEVQAVLVVDGTTLADSYSDKLRAVQYITDTATITDSLAGNVLVLSTDTAKVSDDFIGQRIARSVVQDSAKASDDLVYKRLEIIADSAAVTDSASSRIHALNIITDTALISDTVLDKIIQASLITDTATVSDSVINRLAADVSWQDTIVVQDEVVNTGGYQGQTWTAGMDSWAMSRYQPYNYNRLVVIDNVLYGEADEGIYRLDVEAAPVVAQVKTGKIDLGQGQLTHPSAAYLEYELIGQASMTVHSTQKGLEQQYTYVLPSDLADELTNGRFIFGRGLRGRHFSFDLTMVGTHGYINDLSIDHQPTSRRV